ncbi:mammalian cell entry protein [Mycolicibacterium celeriflavum]|uniref:Mammalian cell entry protein n=1 Tax=Mycolicibacterium celeriflavum TaxID=1249101 RepID=A0A1X0BKB0_MYCCF|nr:mammalian cell entry protein [Mycolicibacterium celeriflavum]MCV7237583.1 mammalian cell entry protein [Mycolicibacterium celeriflavum]ORA42482.1 mammalian cell entry protein [Mycolicibacterium celeriflavum]BBY45574.1 mammalian cell entry protein [Mycolicibacterium celeriflavum]
MTDNTGSTATVPGPKGRRRASRPAGPASGEPAATGRVDPAKPLRARLPKPAGPPPRRQPNRKLVAVVFLAAAVVAIAVLAGLGTLMVGQQRDAEAAQAREQRFVDTASQLVVNMFSYEQDTIDASVDRFVNSTSGPLRAMMTEGDNTQNLKLLFRSTEASAEAVINGAALEKIDEVSKNAAILVSARVTVTDLDGNNQPSQPYRLRVIVHEDDNGNMSGYDLEYPDGGN